MVSTQRLRNVVVVTAVFSIPAACVSVCAAADAANNSVSSKPLERHSENVSVATENGTSFTSHAIAGFSHAFDYDHPLSYLYQTGAGCGGIAIGDFDGNGLPDLFLVNGPGENRLYRQTSRMQFTDATQASGIRDPHDAWGVGATAADFDNDGDLDIYVCNYDAPNLLYENDGTGSFTEVAADYGLAIVDASYMAAPCDYDRDGDLDAYLVTHRLNVGDRWQLPQSSKEAFDSGILEQIGTGKGINGKGVRISAKFEEHFELVDRGEGRIELVIAGQRDHLFQNDGAGNFADVSSAANISGFGIGLAATWWDYDDDGLIDLYVSNDYKGADCLYRNNGDGTFSNVVNQVLPHVPWFSMGSAIADVNNDGRIDLFASDMSGTSHVRQKVAMGDMDKDAWFLKTSNPQQYMRNALYISTGQQRLFEVAHMAGVSNSDWTWSPIFGDFDNDGLIDLFVSNGMSRDYMDSDLLSKMNGRQGDDWKFMPVRKERNLLFRNRGELSFEEVGESWGIKHLTASYGAATADLDLDGDLDIVVANFSDAVQVLENQTASASNVNSVSVDLRGSKNNRFGIGAEVELKLANGAILTRMIAASEGFMSASDPRIHFGIGTEQPTKLTVKWPNGTIQHVSKLESGRHYTIIEATGAESESGPPGASTAPMFATVADGDSAQHIEQPYDDFAVQPLLPCKMSQQGPGLVIADFNGDDVDDLFLSGAAGQAGQIFLRNGNAWSRILFEHSHSTEQLGAVAFDWNGDGNRELFVVGGGVESNQDDPNLQDQLYVNQGNGQFQLIEGALPNTAHSGSCVAAADYDRDGDIDLFVGGRVIPGQYPLSSPSRLLRNDGDRFTEASYAFSTPEADSRTIPLERVTSAVWTDFDNDGWIDLIVTQHWGPIRCFHNDHGTLRESTSEAGLASYSGWWNGIAGADVDNDGDIDFVATNQGLNTKYHATDEHPSLLYFGDFEGNGRSRIVEAAYEGQTLYPGRGRSCSTSAMPSLSNRFDDFHSFAVATLEEVYSPSRLDQSQRFAANFFETSLLINEGDGRFTVRALPRIAQISPGFGIAVQDVDGDSNADIYFVQNSFSPQPETGHMDGGMSLLLQGDGQGNFTPVEPGKSGLIVPGDAKSLVVTDATHDGRPDLLVGINNASTMTLANQSDSGAFAQLQLTDKRNPKNSDAIGARIVVHFDNGQQTAIERTAGSGYLSQSSNSIFVGLGHRKIQAVDVRWPDGESGRYEVNAATNPIRIVRQ
ncbi:MAG: VCBS repeat-containing protein [Planctomycetales bacterium]|nr:VCBS repeat-containing protein [Planctomycetales bacterium]